MSTTTDEAQGTQEGTEPTSVEDFIQGKNGERRAAPVNSVKPNGKAEISSRDKFLARVQDTSKPAPFEVHGETVLTRGLSARERDESRTLATEENGSINGFVLECAYVSIGMVEPSFTIEELQNFTEGWLDPIYYRILDQTTMRERATVMGVDGPAPLVHRTGFARISQSPIIGRETT
jgi:hypothetical protein